MTAAVMALLFFVTIFHLAAKAQSPDSSPQAIRTAIIQAIGANGRSVEVSITLNVFRVSRVNSNLNQTTHSARDGEASRIATLVAKMIAGNKSYKNIHTIRVLYVAKLRPGGYEKVIDTADFRRDSSGVFQFHTT